MKLYSRLSLITSVTLVTGYVFAYAYTTLTLSDADSGKPLTSTLMQAVMGNITELNTRVNSLASGGGNLWGTGASNSINYTAGNVGIGNASPNATLDIKRMTSDSNFATYIDGADVANYGLGVNIANITSSKAIADFKSGNVSKLFVRADGNVGIGTTSPTSKLHVVDTSGTATTLLLGETGEVPELKAGGTNTDLRLSAVGAGGWLALQTNGTDRLLVGASGNVGIGTASPSAILDVQATISGTTWVQFGNSHTITPGDGVGLKLTPSGGYFPATIQVMKTGTTGDHSNKMILQTVNAGSTANTNQLVLDPTGNVGIGTPSPLVPLHVGIGGTNMGNGYEKIVASDTNTAGIAIHIGAKSLYMYQDFAGNTKLDAYDYSNNIALPVQLGGNGGGYVYVSATGKVGIGMQNPTYQFQISTDSAGKPNGGSWANSSDQRIKKNVISISDALEKITSLRGVQYEWKNPGEHAAQDGEVRAGFLAQEVAKVFPKFVNTIDASGKDKSLTPDGKIKNLSLPFDFDAYLVEAIKEQQKQISALQAKVQVLENGR